jgi:hypothetical protein
MHLLNRIKFKIATINIQWIVRGVVIDFEPEERLDIRRTRQDAYIVKKKKHDSPRRPQQDSPRFPPNKVVVSYFVLSDKW